MKFGKVMINLRKIVMVTLIVALILTSSIILYLGTQRDGSFVLNQQLYTVRL